MNGSFPHQWPVFCGPCTLAIGRSARAGAMPLLRFRAPARTSPARRRSRLRPQLRQCLFRRRRARSIESRRESWRRCVRRATCSRGMARRRNLTCPAVEKDFDMRDHFGIVLAGGARNPQRSFDAGTHGRHSHAQSHLCDARACMPRRHMGFGRELLSATMAIPARVPVKAAGRRISSPPKDPPANRYPRTRWSEPIRISVVTTSRISVIGRLGCAPTPAGFSRRRPHPPAIVGARAANDCIGHARHPLGPCGRVGALADRAPHPRLPAGGAGPCARGLKRTVRAYCDRLSISGRHQPIPRRGQSAFRALRADRRPQ